MPKRLLLCFALLACALPAFADVDEAREFYTEGLSLEASKDYAGAIADFKAALKADPAYDFAHKQLGNCHYYLGQIRMALKQYDLYLAAHPDDTATYAFTQKLRGRADGPAPRTTEAREAAEPGAGSESEGLTHSRFYIGFGGGPAMNSNSDLSDLVGAGSSIQDSGAGIFDTHFGYQWLNGPALEVGEEVFFRVATIQDSYGDTFPFAGFDSTVYIEPLYRLPLGRRIALLGGIKLGYASATATFSNDSVDGIGSADSVLVEPELRFQFLAGRMLGLELGAQYRSVTFSFDSYNGSSQPSTWKMSDSGLSLRLGLDIYFGRIID